MRLRRFTHHSRMYDYILRTVIHSYNVSSNSLIANFSTCNFNFYFNNNLMQRDSAQKKGPLRRDPFEIKLKACYSIQIYKAVESNFYLRKIIYQREISLLKKTQLRIRSKKTCNEIALGTFPIGTSNTQDQMLEHR